MEIITTHKNVDFDGLASLLAAAKIYLRAAPVLPKSVNPNVRAFLSMHKDLFALPKVSDVDLSTIGKLIVVDVCKWNRLEQMDALRGKEGLEIHLWDHHPEEPDIDANWSCREFIGATISLLTKELEKRQCEISPILATLFLAGVYEDTGNLTFPSTTADDARAAAFLLDRKANLHLISSFLRPAYGPKQKDVLFQMLQNEEQERINGYLVSINNATIEGHTPGLAIVVDMYEDILNVDAAFGIFTEAKKNRSMVIGRSAVDDINIGAMMRTLGGGGHPRAGSAMIKSSAPEMLREWIVELIQGNQHASVVVSDLMTSPVITVQHDVPMKDVALMLRDKGCTGFPVVEGEKIAGIISRRDFGRVSKPAHLEAPVRTYMSRSVVNIGPGCSVGKAARLLVKNDIGRLPVVENGKLVGIITRSDAIRYYYDFFPE
ncbi:MAG: CBS domain-containing protein [Deltaproteobacteria bacterium]|nr:CBS domain-containing protein [Deltaproteobacteria bacterium]